MCRMLLAVGKVPVNSLLDSAIAMAKDETVVHELNEEKGQGSWTHCDGWGIAYMNSKGKWIVEKSTEAIYLDPKVDLFRNVKTNLMIVHMRKKMGSEVAYNNTHPFKFEKGNPGSVLFCHNGFIDEEITHDKEFTVKGETDSEKLFYSILTDLKKNKLEKAIRRNFKRYKKITGTNIILSTKEKSVIAVKKNYFPKYYQMKMGWDDERLIISSEILPVFDGMTWQPLAQGDIISVNNDTRDVTISKQRNPIVQQFIDMLSNINEKLYINIGIDQK